MKLSKYTWIILIFLFWSISGDTFVIQPYDTTVSVTTSYEFSMFFDNDITPVMGSDLTILFPIEYQGRLADSTYSCNIISWFTDIFPTPSCSITSSMLRVKDLFTTGQTYTMYSILVFKVDSIRNPPSIKPTANFFLGLTLDTQIYSLEVEGVTANPSSMTCSITTSPAEVNQKGNMIINFNAPEFPLGSTLQIQFSAYWSQALPYKLAGTSIIQSASLSCQGVLNSNSGVACTFQQVGQNYIVTASSVVSISRTATTVSFKMGTVLSPPTVKPQNSFTMTSYLNDHVMSDCTGMAVTASVGALSVGSFTTFSNIVNAVSVGTLSFTVNSNIVITDTIIVTFPATILLTSLTSIFISNGGTNIPSPNKSGQTVTILGATVFQGGTLSISFTNVKNPPSEITTSAFVFRYQRDGYNMEASTGTIKYTAYRSTITTASLTASLLQIGAVSTYTVVFTLGQPLTVNSAVLIGLPTALQGRVLSCSLYTCSYTSSLITYTGVPTAAGSTVTVSFSLTNPVSLGSTTSLTLYTLYDSSSSGSVVEYVNTGLSVSLIARASSSANAAITATSYVVNAFPSTVIIAITNLNPLLAYSYLVAYIPSQFTVTSFYTCQAGSFSVSCAFDSATRLLTFSSLSTAVLAGQLASSPFTIENLINPPSTMPTSSFQLRLYNSNNQLIQYINSGLSVRMTTAASFSALSLTPSNSINSAVTTLRVTFNVPSTTYQNNTVLVITLPSIIALSSITCTAISGNIQGISSCTTISNKIKLLIVYGLLSTLTSTVIEVGTYNNYPSIQPYTIQVDLFGDSFQQSKLCSNSNSPTTLVNTQLGSITLSSFSFSTPTLQSTSNLNIYITSTSSNLIGKMTIEFPSDFSLSGASCSAPSSLSCSLQSSRIFVLTTLTAFSMPVTISIMNLVTPTYTPSLYIYLLTFSASNYQMDSNQNIIFATTCTVPCRTCSVSTPTVCNSCYNDTTLSQVMGAIYLNGTNCVSICGIGNYLDTASSSCMGCPSTCSSCTSLTNCISCSSGFLFNSSCLTSCPYTYYGFNFQCFPCSTQYFCESCTDSYHCSSCLSGYFYYNNKCYANCPASITYQNSFNRSCDGCPANCTYCTSVSNIVSCTTCEPGYVMDNARCYLSCVTSGLYAVGGVCQGCSSLCNTCSLAFSNCTSCYSNSSNPYLFNFNCISTCPSGYYPDNSLYQCQKCTSPCELCTSVSVSSCVSCVLGYYLFGSSCLSSCPTNYYNSTTSCLPCISPCLTCTAELSCLSCTNNTFLYQTQCLTQCPTGMAVINGNQCLVCMSICRTCETLTSCTACYNGSYLYNGTCQSTCPSLTYPQAASGNCQPCVSPCLACSSSTFCTSCVDSTKFLVGGSCVACNSPCLTCSLSISNCTSCLTNTSTPYYLSFNCLATCPGGYFGQISLGQCITCAYPCLSCTGVTNSSCSSCQAGFYYLSSLCYTFCPSEYFNNLTVCSSCQSPCLTCTAATTCTSCISGKYLQGSDCVANCGSGMTVLSNAICSFCASSCLTCLSANSSACTSCYNTTYLYNQACSNTCPTTKYADGSLNICQQCMAPCSTCSSLTYCLTCLDSALFLVNGTCLGCQSPCSTCSSSITTCASCSASTGYAYLLSNKCLATCPYSYYNDAALNICSPCNTPCESCSTASTSSCLTCLPDYLFLSGLCLFPCPSGYYSNSTNCLACESPCLACYDTTNCISCLGGFYLQGSQCVTNCSDGMTLISNSYCQYCQGNCLTCLSSNNSFCTSCQSTYYLYTGSCMSSCDIGYFKDDVNHVCAPCLSPCNTCASSSICLTCTDPSLFLVNNTCVSCLSPCLTCSILRNSCTSCDQLSSYSILYSNLCLNSCPSGYYSSLFTCFRCNSPCDTCNSASNATCLTCLTGFLTYNSTCLTNCPTGFYSNTLTCLPCANNCSTCSSDTVCLTCRAGEYLLGSSCVTSCPNGTTSGTSGTVCSFCSASCSSCQSSNISYCTSCPSNTYLYTDQCVSSCPPSFYQNTGLSICSSCVNPCSTCSSLTQCLTCLDPNSFLINFSCVGCDSSCQTCSGSPSSCTSCNTSSIKPYLYGTGCVTTCPDTFYPDSSSICKTCSSPCYTCNGLGNQNCLTCLVDYYQLGNLCYAACPSGYYPQVNICLACSSPCASCLDSSTLSCTSCIGGLYLLGSSCVTNCSGLSIVGNTCQSCASTCFTCQSNNNTYCTSCSLGLYLFQGSCTSSCSPTYYPDTASSTCLTCINSCNTCTSTTSCLTCKDPALFLINSQCVSCSSVCLTCSITINNCTSCNTTSTYPILFGTTCISSCPITYYNDTLISCAACSSPCANCVGTGTSSCTSCRSGYYFLNNICYSTCPSTFYPNVNVCYSCVTPCYTCSSNQFTCLSCISGKYLRGSTCVASCQSGQTLINSTYCQICQGNCLTCLSTNLTYCTSCLSGLYQLGGICYTTCPTYYYANSNTSTCIACKLPCSTCNSQLQCLSCSPSSLFLVNTQCLSCSSPCITCSTIRSNCTSCDTSSGFPYLFSSSCLVTCPSTYFDSGAYTCTKCSSPCDTCTSLSVCLTCLPGFSKLGSYCYDNCPSLFYTNGTDCLSCNLALCKTCVTTADTCLSCATGLYLLGSSCSGSCPPGMNIYNGQVCLSCSGNCLTCLTSNSSYCTTCYPNSYDYMGSCVSTCPTFFFSDDASGSCKACKSPCKECISLTECLNCLNPLFYLQDSTCTSSCTYPLLGLNGTCYRCSSQCLTCTQTLSTCLLCATNFFYFPSTFTCSLICSFFVLPASMSTSGNKQCTQTCPVGTFTDSSSSNCQSCPSSCSQCSSLTSCSVCKSTYSFYQNFCYLPCPTEAPYSINSTCLICNIANCNICQNITFCGTCNTNYLKIVSSSSSSCISACPTGYNYNSTSFSCISSNSSSNSTNNNGTATNATTSVVSSSVPPFTFLISSASLVFISFICKFKQSQTNLGLMVYLSLSFGTICCLINLIILELSNSGVMKGQFTSISVSSYLLFSSGGIQVLSSIGVVIAMLKIKDRGLLKLWKEYPIVTVAILLLSSVDSSLMFLTITNLMNLECFKAKFNDQNMQKAFKFTLAVSIVTKLLNIIYSSLQLFYSSNTARLLQSIANYPIDNNYSNQFIVVSCITMGVVAYLLYQMSPEQKIQNSKTDDPLIDAKIYDKRNQSSEQILLDLQSNDLAIDISSIEEEKQLSFGQQKKYKNKKITPDEMLEIMNNGILEKEEKSETEVQKENNNDNTDGLIKHEQEEVEQEIEDINNVFYFEDDQIQENVEGIKVQPKKQQQKEQQILEQSPQNIKPSVQNNNYTNPGEISDIIQLQRHQEQPSNILYNQIQAIQDVIHENTKTQIINLNVEGDKKQQQKHSPSQLSKYQPNKKLQQQFARSYYDDANKFNAYQERAQDQLKNTGNFINFEVDNRDYNQLNSLEEVSFQKKEKFIKIEEPESNNQFMDFEPAFPKEEFIPDSNTFGRTIQFQTIPQPNVIQIDEQQSYKEQTSPDIYKKQQLADNTYYEQQQNYEDFKPSEGLRGNKRKHKGKPDIPLPKNEIEKQIMNIYQKKEKKGLPPKKKRYLDPSPGTGTKQSNYVEYSMEDKEFYQQKKATKPIFSGQIKKDAPRYNQSRASSKFLYDEQEAPQKPSLKLRKSSFKKIGEMIIDQSQSSARK